MISSQDNKSDQKSSLQSISNGFSYFINKATTLYKSYETKHDVIHNEKSIEQESKTSFIHSTNNPNSHWKWDNNGSWIHFEPSTSNQIDSNITSYLTSIKTMDTNNNTLTFMLCKGSFFTSTQNKGIYFCTVEFAINYQNPIKSIHQINNKTNYKRKLQRNPAFTFHSKKKDDIKNKKAKTWSELYYDMQNIDINDYIPYRKIPNLDELLIGTTDLYIPFWWNNANTTSKCIFGSNVFELSLKRKISKEICDKFMNGLQFDNDTNDEFEVTNIYCIQNKSLYRLYQAFKMILTDHLNDDGINERYLFHGTNMNSAKSICQTGFNRDYGQVMAYGKGVYMAKYSGYSSDKRYSVPDKDNNQYMFLCRVVLGEWCKGDVNYKMPPIKSNKSYHNYESMVNNLKKPTIFVICKDNQVYPEFLIKFKRIPKCLFVDAFE